MTFFHQIFDETLSDLASKKKSYGIKIQNQEFRVRIAIIRSNGWGKFRVLGSKTENLFGLRLPLALKLEL